MMGGGKEIQASEINAGSGLGLQIRSRSRFDYHAIWQNDFRIFDSESVINYFRGHVYDVASIFGKNSSGTSGCLQQTVCDATDPGQDKIQPDHDNAVCRTTRGLYIYLAAGMTTNDDVELTFSSRMNRRYNESAEFDSASCITHRKYSEYSHIDSTPFLSLVQGSGPSIFHHCRSQLYDNPTARSGSLSLASSDELHSSISVPWLSKKYLKTIIRVWKEVDKRILLATPHLSESSRRVRAKCLDMCTLCPRACVLVGKSDYSKGLML